MRREEIEEQISDAEEELVVIEFQLGLPKEEREGEKTGQQLARDRQACKKRIRDLEKWLRSGFFVGRGGGAPDSSHSQREVRP